MPGGIGRSFNIDHAKFDTAGSTLYGSDGDALWHEGRLVKVAAGAEFPDGYFDRFDSIALVSFLLLIVLTRKKRGKIKDLLSD